MLEDALLPTLEGGRHPHLALLVRSPDELAPVLASFYGLGARRDGWLVHRASPGRADADRAALTEAGLEVPTLEAQGRFTVVEGTPGEAPGQEEQRWEDAYRAALERGFASLWYSRWIGQGHGDTLRVDHAWGLWSSGLRVVSLCPYDATGCDAAAMLDRFATLLEFHDGVIVAGGGTAALHDAPSVLVRR